MLLEDDNEMDEEEEVICSSMYLKRISMTSSTVGSRNVFGMYQTKRLGTVSEFMT